MNLVQPVLLLLVAGVVLVYLARLRSQLVERLIVLAIATSACVLIANPDFSNVLARYVGIGRGVDLVIYVSFCGVGFLLLLLFSKTRDLEAKITELARSIALQGAIRRPPAPE